MFIEKIDPQLIEEIREALYEEQKELQANWDGEIVDLKSRSNEFENIVRSEIFGQYLDTPLQMLADTIFECFPFIKENEMATFPVPFSEIFISENGNSKEVYLDVRIGQLGQFDWDKQALSDIELTQLEKLYEELTKLYYDLEIETTLYISPIPLEEIPNDYLDDDDDEHEFVRIEF
ncbi:hypothetical protein [Heyndrickxia oleronia]|uniref:hypothetical protein n=1 Tax=Heyndrickxia oleronia TaxID=38875 RepID=UPI003751532B